MAIIGTHARAEDYKVFQAVTIGKSPVKSGFTGTLKARGMVLGDWAYDVLRNRRVTIANTESRVKLVKISIEDLGFNKGASLYKIYRRAKELGLQLCPAEVGPRLRLQYTNQPLDEWLVIAMEGIKSSDDGLGLFMVGRGGMGLWLLGCNGDPDAIWNKNAHFLFVLPQ